MPNPHPNSIGARVRAYAQHPLWLPRRLTWELLRRTRDSVIVSTPQGAFLIRTANKVIGTQLYTRREYEDGVMRHAMCALIDAGLSPEGKTVIDVGANIGMSSISMLNGRYCRRTIAIEPEPTNFADLRDNVVRNGMLDRVQCHQFAASDTEGTLTMELADVNFGDHRVRVGGGGAGVYGEAARSTVTVPARPLDAFIADTPAIGALWIDVQGYDYFVLKGGQRLVRTVPVITEFWPYGQRRAGVTPAAYTQLLTTLFSHCYIVRDDSRTDALPIHAITSAYAEIADGISDLTLVLVPHRL